MKKVFNGLKVIIVICACLCSSILFAGCDNTDDKIYIGNVMSYENIDITVNALTEKKVESGDYNGLINITVNVTLKNNKSNDFDFPYSEVYIKTEDKSQKYDISYGMDYIFGDVIISGAQKTYEMNFYTPYSFKDKNFRIVFDWGLFSAEKEYCLYMKDGTAYAGSYKTEEEINIENICKMRDDVYNIFKLYVYDKISSSMYYSDVQNLIDNTENQVKSELSTFILMLDLSNGTYCPKWVAQVTINNGKTYSLFAIDIQCSTSFKCQNKHMIKYEIK